MDKLAWQSVQDYQLVLENLNEGIFVVDQGMFVYVSSRLATMLGYRVEQVMGRSFIDVFSAEDRPLVWERHRARLAGEQVPAQYDVHLLMADGRQIFCELSINLVQHASGRPVVLGSVRDITHQKAELARLEASKAELTSIYNELPDVFYRTDMQGIITMMSPSCFDIIGYTQQEMMGTPLSQYYETPEYRQKIVQAISAGQGRAVKVEAPLKRKDGRVVWMSTNSFVRLDAGGKPFALEGVARDISERKSMEDKLTMLARTDDLTGVCNRRYFMERADETIALMKRYQRPLSLMIADLDHFKKINDKYGHYGGDLALQAFVNACRQEIREADILGRLGGEEFCLMLPETTLENARHLVERIRTATASIQIPIAEYKIGLTVSIGVAEMRAEDSGLDALMRRADFAMYQAKERGRNQVAVA